MADTVAPIRQINERGWPFDDSQGMSFTMAGPDRRSSETHRSVRAAGSRSWLAVGVWPRLETGGTGCPADAGFHQA